MKAMEVSGIEGTFRTTCENVMQVLRTNKDSVMAMMEVNNIHSIACSTLPGYTPSVPKYSPD